MPMYDRNQKYSPLSGWEIAVLIFAVLQIVAYIFGKGIVR